MCPDSVKTHEIIIIVSSTACSIMQESLHNYPFVQQEAEEVPTLVEVNQVDFLHMCTHTGTTHTLIN